MKKTVFSILVFGIVAYLCVNFLILEPIGYRTVTNLEKYGKYNNYYVSSKLKNEFHGLLPNKEIVQQYGKKYIYYYSGPIAGNLSFSVYLQTQMDYNSLQNEEQRILSLADHCFTDGDISIYFVNASLDGINELYDDEILDGLEMCFELGLIDRKQLEIKYFAGNLWDGTIRHEHTDIFMSELLDICKNS